MAPEQVLGYVGPAGDVITSLMERLVDPILACHVTSRTPSADAQNSVAKQMHAVVLLYNYYYRQQKPEVEFLDFVSFCKLALSRKSPPLTSFMEVTRRIELKFKENRLSMTEKAVKDACDIAASLDASRDFPSLGGCVVSKVAILVIDSERENCWLSFGSVTKGVWSVIEKEIDSKLKILVYEDDKVGAKRKNPIQKVSDDCKLLQIAFDTVKDITGIDSVGLSVLESHYTYSLSKEKMAVKFYMMKYCKKFDPKHTVPLKFLVDSLRGPLAEKYDDGWSTMEEFINYHEMLPYMRFISSWLSSFRKDLCLPSLNGQNAPNSPNVDSVKLSRSGIAPAAAASPISANPKGYTRKGPSQSVATNNINPNKSNKISEVAVSVKEETFINADIFGSDEYEYLKGPSLGTKNCNKTSSEGENKTKKPNSTQVNNQTSVQHGVNLQLGNSNHLEPNATLALVQFEAARDTMMKNSQDSEVLQLALALHYRKREELYSKICTMENELALHEDCIQRMRDGGEVDLARQTINSVLSGNHDFLRKTGGQNKTGLSNIFFPGRSSYEDLEYTCVKNNWRLPGYVVGPSDGKFWAVVIVGSKDFEVSVKGGLENSPLEARESGAAGMIAKLRERFSGC